MGIFGNFFYGAGNKENKKYDWLACCFPCMGFAFTGKRNAIGNRSTKGIPPQVNLICLEPVH
jgi:hypothetical protein